MNAHQYDRTTKLVAVLAIVLLSLAGCSTRSVNFNKFESTRHPHLEVRINPEYKYLTNLKFVERRLSVDKSRELKIQVETFFFIPNVITEGVIPKYVYVKIEEIPESYFVQPYLRPDIYMSHRYMKLGWHNFEVGTNIAFPAAGVDHQLGELIKEGYMMPTCVLRRVAARVVNNRKTALVVVYSEDPSLSGFDCNTWKDDMKGYSDKQKQYVHEFNTRAMSMFEVMASD